MEVVSVLLFVVGIGVVWWLVDRWRSNRRSISATPEAQAQRRATLARKELIRRFPDRNPDSRVAVTKRVDALEPGELLKAVDGGGGDVALLGPETPGRSREDTHFVVFTGFSEAASGPLVGICDLDGYGTRSLEIPMDDLVVAYVTP